MPGAHSTSSALSLPWRNIARRSVPYVISAGTTSTSIPPSCWKYVNWVICIPSSQTSQPRPHAPSVGCSPVVLDEARVVPREVDAERTSSEPQYWSRTSSGLSEDDLQLVVVLKPERVLAVAPVGQADDRLHVGGPPLRGPRQRRNVAGFIVPAASSVCSCNCMITHPRSAQYAWSEASMSW